MRIATLTLAALCAAFTAVQAQSFHRLDAAHQVQAVTPSVDMTGEEIIPYQPLNAQNVGDIESLNMTLNIYLYNRKL